MDRAIRHALEQSRPAMKMLEQHGIYYYDPRPGNISFGDEDEQEL